MSKQKIINGDCIETMKRLKSCSISSIITDPPYHLKSIVERFGKENSKPASSGTEGSKGVFGRSSKGFMGKEWDGGDIAFNTEVWTEALRVTKPGGFLFAFGGTRTAHRMAVAIEDSGWVCRDYIEWVYSSGFAKATKLDTGMKKYGGNVEEWKSHKSPLLKPAHEPIYIFQKPMLDEGEPNVIDWKAPFFYCAKTSTKERSVGGKVKNNHPCLKPIKLLSYLLDLVTPPENYKKDFVILDPFMGSGSMGCACVIKDVNYIGIELDEEYCKIAQARIEAYQDEK